MSDEEEKGSEAREAPSGKSSKGLVVVVLAAAVVLGGGAAAAGAVVAMRVGTPQAAPAPSASAEEKVMGTVDFASIVVDIHSADGTSHHLRVSLSAEVPPDGVKEDVENLMPRGREAAIGFLRALTYEEATAPASFDRIKTELAKRIIEAVGEKRVAAIILTDFVVQ
jgi:flagellar FliL protein